MNQLPNTEVNQEYNAEQIQVLEGLEPVRKRPGMYIGSTSETGLHHLVYEIVDNSVDEALAGYCTEINVTITGENAIRVSDNGRGMPVDIHPKLGIPAVEVIHTVLHAGGKFGGGGYKVSGGLHGVGASVVNALSEAMEVEVKRDGKVYRQRYERGKTMYPLKETGVSDVTGTTTWFKPDPEIFRDTVVFNYSTLGHRLRERERVFHDRLFHDCEYSTIYLYQLKNPNPGFVLQESEVARIRWMTLRELNLSVMNPAFPHCLDDEAELEMLRTALQNLKS